MRPKTILLLCLGIVISACNQDAPGAYRSNALEEHLQNPLFAEQYFESLVQRMVELVIRQDPIMDNEEKKAIADSVRQEGLKKAIIEEYAIGAHVNFNYFYSAIDNELELLGTDTRRQTNIDGLIRLPATDQIAALKIVKPKMIETGHIAVTVKESLLGKIFSLGEKFVDAARKVHKPGIIGPFALQGVVIAEEGREDIVIFDVSMRIPGSPGTMFTPYSAYLYHNPVSVGERAAMEIRKAVEQNKLDIICT